MTKVHFKITSQSIYKSSGSFDLFHIIIQLSIKSSNINFIINTVNKYTFICSLIADITDIGSFLNQGLSG